MSPNDPASETPGLALRLFGPMQITLDGVPLAGLKIQKERWLLALLAIKNGSVNREWLATTLWESSLEFQALYNLRRSLVNLRDALKQEAGRLQSPTPRTIQLDLNGAHCDLHAFEAALLRDDDASLEEAIALYRAPFLEDCNEPWAQDERARLTAEALKALATAAERARTRGDLERTIAHLRRLVQIEPEQESAQRKLMEALAERGDLAAVTQAYGTLRRYLLDRYRREPMPETRELYLRLTQTRPGTTVAPPRPDPAPAPPEDPAPKGPLSPDSRLYIVRAEDQRFFDAIVRGDCLVLAKGPREIGKSSLLARGIHQGRRAGARVLITDFQKFTPAILDSSESLLRYLADQIDRKLELDAPPWDTRLSPADNLERVLLRALRGAQTPRLVWALDEVDAVFSYGYASEFFALFRAWHNERALDPDGPLRNLTVAMAYATEAHLFITDLNQSPFNVGTRVLLSDLSHDELAELNRRYDEPLRTPAELDRLWQLTEGHPYLTQVSLYAIAREGALLSDLETAPLRDDETPFSNLLRRQLRYLKQDPALAHAVMGVLTGEPGALTRELFFRLRSAGILDGESPETARCRCQIYALFFRRCLSHD